MSEGCCGVQNTQGQLQTIVLGATVTSCLKVSCSLKFFSQGAEYFLPRGLDPVETKRGGNLSVTKYLLEDYYVQGLCEALGNPRTNIITDIITEGVKGKHSYGA